MSQDLIPLDVVDADLVDDFGLCLSDGFPNCPGGPAPLVPDPFDSDVGNTHRLTYLHAPCASDRAMDV